MRCLREIPAAPTGAPYSEGEARFMRKWFNYADIMREPYSIEKLRYFLVFRPSHEPDTQRFNALYITSSPLWRMTFASGQPRGAEPKTVRKSPQFADFL